MDMLAGFEGELALLEMQPDRRGDGDGIDVAVGEQVLIFGGGKGDSELCGRGIGPPYADKMNRVGIRAAGRQVVRTLSHDGRRERPDRLQRNRGARE